MEKQTIYTVGNEAAKYVEEEAIFLPRHVGTRSFSSRDGDKAWLIFDKETGGTSVLPHIDSDSPYMYGRYTFLTKEEAEAQLVKEAEKKKQRLQREIEQKQKELEALK